MKFSIITICLNGREFLEEAIKSVLSQTQVDLEYILIDGGSSDGSLDIIHKWAFIDNRLTWYSGPDQGISDAMNKGLAFASGDIVAFLHADDRYVADWILAEVATSFDRYPEAVWATGGINEIDALGRRLRTISVRDYSCRRLRRNNIILHPATFVRRKELVSMGGFDSSLRYVMDYDLWLRLGQETPPLPLNFVIADFRVHKGSLSFRERLAALSEAYAVRKKYITSPFAGTGHSFYYFLQKSVVKALCPRVKK